MKPEYFKIPNPCSADWNKMTPTELGAFCAQCNKEVVDLHPVPADEIRATIRANNNPCIRILQSQIDEMNFSEWYRSISLSKQLRYLFLFTLLLVFQNNGKTQETDTTFIPYSNEYLDELEATKVDLAEEKLDTLTLKPPTDSNGYVFVREHWGDIVIPPMPEVWMGIPPMEPPIVAPWFNIESFQLISYTDTFEVQEETPLDVTQKNTLFLNGNTYDFEIIEAQLHFTYKAVKPQKVRIKIMNEIGEMVYFIPIELGIGQNKVIYSIEKFARGLYTISLESEGEKNSAEIIYL